MIAIVRLDVSLHRIGKSSERLFAVPRSAANFERAWLRCTALVCVIIGHILLLHLELDPGAGLPTPLLSGRDQRSEEHTSELQSLMRISYAVFCFKKKTFDS